MRRILFIALAGLLVLLVGAWLALDSMIAAAVEKGGSHALGVETKLGRANASLLGGSLGLNELDIANAPGFTAPFFLRVGHTSVAVSPASLIGDSIEVPSFVLVDVEVHLEHSGKGSNYGVILDSLERFESAPQEQGPAQSGKKFIVRDVRISNVKVHANIAPGVLGKGGEFSVTIPEIQLTDVGTAEGGRSVAELIGDLVTVVLSAAIESGSGSLPKELLGGLGSSLDELGGSSLDQLRSQVGAGLDQLGKDAGKLIEGFGKGIDQLRK